MIIKYRENFNQEDIRKLLKEPLFDIKFKFGLTKFTELINKNAFSDDYLLLIDEDNRNISLWSINKY